MKAVPALVLLLLLLSPGPVAPGKRGQRGPKPAASAALELDPGDEAASGSGQQPQAAANATCEAVMLTGQVRAVDLRPCLPAVCFDRKQVLCAAAILQILR